MELVEQLAATVRRVDGQYHSPLLTLQAYAQFIRTVSRRSQSLDATTTSTAALSQSSSLSPQRRLSAGDSRQTLALLVVDCLLRCNQSGLGLHATLQAAVLKANRSQEERGDSAAQASLEAFPVLQQCVARQRRQYTSSCSPLSASASPGLAVAENLWTEAVEPIADYFRAAVDLATGVLGATWEESALLGLQSYTLGREAQPPSPQQKEDDEAAAAAAPRVGALHFAEVGVMEVEAARFGVRADVVLALLQLTLQNWAAVELGWRRAERALHLQTASQLCKAAALRTAAESLTSPLSRCTEEPEEEEAMAEGQSARLACPLGAAVAMAQALNDCTIRSAVLCEFEPVQAALRTELMPRLSEMRADVGDDDDKDDALTLRLLSGLAFSTFGVAESYTASDAALLTLQEALDQLQQAHRAAGDDDTEGLVLQGVVEAIYKPLVAYVEAARSKRTIATTATAATTTTAAGGGGATSSMTSSSSPVTKGSPVSRSAPAQKTRGARKARRSLGHAAARALPPPPPLGAALRAYMRHGGVPLYVTGLVSAAAVRQHLADDRVESLAQALQSALSFLDVPVPVVAVLLCAKAPLQLAVELDRHLHSSSSGGGSGGDGGGGALAATPPLLSRSVWGSVGPAPLLQSPLPPAVLALAKREVGGSGGAVSSVRASLPRPSAANANATGTTTSASTTAMAMFQPKPMSKKALAETQKEVSTAVKVLGQRLSALLKVERAFEAQWAATETVKRALMAYYVPQACRAWCEARRLAQCAEQVRRDHSARVLTRFVRYLAAEKPHLHGAVRQRQQECERQDAAATVLQKYARRWLAKEAKARLLREKQSFLRDLTRVQSLHRGRQARARCAEYRLARAAQDREEAALLSAHFAATTIQRVYRGHATRLALLRAAGYGYVATRLHYRDSRHASATLIQARVRGMLVRRRYGAAVRARCLYGRNVYRAAVLGDSCERIQRWYRAQRHRRHQQVVAVVVADTDVPCFRPAIADNAEARAADVCRALVLRKQLAQHTAERAAAVEARRGETYAPFNVDERVF